MKKWVTCCVAVGSVVAVGIAVRQILIPRTLTSTALRLGKGAG